MKPSTILKFVILFLYVNILSAQESKIEGNTLIVYGVGNIEAPANRAQINFSVKGFGPSIQAAIDATRKKVADMTSKLFAVGLNQNNLSTSSFSSGDNFDGKAFWSSNKDYRTQMSVYISIDSLELIEGVITALAGSQIEQLSNISFSLKNDSTLKMEARRLATINAQQKSRLIASQLGISLGRVLYVEELLSYSDGDFYLPPRQDRAMYSLNAVSVTSGSSIFYGAQRFSVKSGVKIVYEIK
jgi:uncharacterized protein YggE